MIPTRRKTSKVLLRQRSSRNQRLRHGSSHCCSAEIYARIQELLDTNQTCRVPPTYESMLNRAFLKFSECRPRIQHVKDRLQESCDLLSQVEKLLDFFADPARLWAYLSGEESEESSEETVVNESQATSSKTQAPDADSAPRKRDCDATSGESYCSKRPDVDTIREEIEEELPVEIGSRMPELVEVYEKRTALRDSASLPRNFLSRFHKKNLETASFEISPYDRTNSMTGPAWSASSKKFKTSTPAERSPFIRFGSPRISLIPHHQIKSARKRRKAILIDRPEENGAWMGTPVIRNQPNSSGNEANLPKRLSIDLTESPEKVLDRRSEGAAATLQTSLDPQQTASGSALLSDAENIAGEKADAEQEGQVSERKMDSPKPAPAACTRRNLRSRAGTAAQAQTVSKRTSSSGKTLGAKPTRIVEAPPPTVDRPDTANLSKRTLGKALPNSCHSESTRKKRRK